MERNLTKYMVWSLDSEETQTFTDIVSAKDADTAVRKVRRQRPYAEIDSVAPVMRLADYIRELQEEL